MLFPEPHGFYRTDWQSSYSEGCLDFSQFGFRSGTAADFHQMSVAVLSGSRTFISNDSNPYSSMISSRPDCSKYSVTKLLICFLTQSALRRQTVIDYRAGSYILQLSFVGSTFEEIGNL